MIRRLILCVFLLSFIFCGFAQQKTAVGNWSYHTPFAATYDIAQFYTQICASSKTTVLLYDTESKNIEFLNKTNGLSDIEISCLASNASNSLLLIGYENGNLDVIDQSERIENFDDLKRSEITGSKRIEEVKIIDQTAYLLGGFGVLEFDLEKREFKNRYTVDDQNLTVFDFTLYQNHFYAFTNLGVYTIAIEAVQVNTQTQWNRLKEGYFNHAILFDQQIILNQYLEDESDTIFSFDGNNFSALNLEGETQQVFSIDFIQNRILLATQYNINVYDENYTRTNVVFTYDEQANKNVDLNAAMFDDQGKVWIAENRFTLGNSDAQTFEVSGPKTNSAFRMFEQNNKIYVAPGGVNPTISAPFFQTADVFVYHDFTWENLSDQYTIFESQKDILGLSVYGSNIATASASSGVNILSPEAQTNFVSDGSVLESNMVSALSYDQMGNLWLGNNNSAEGFRVYTSDQQWFSFAISELSNRFNIRDLMVSSSSLKWLQVLDGPNPGVLVYDDNQTVENASDDRYKIFNSAINTGNLPSNKVYAFAEDLDQNVWIGTTSGLAVFDAAADIVNNPTDARQVEANVDGFLVTVLEDQYITSIAIDQANRKWIGTENNGVFLLSESADQQVLRFNTENSPLLSNSILDIAILNQTGEVLIATDKGICIYRSDASTAASDFSSALIFPNPIKPNYSGLISVTGLTKNAEVSITDVSGNAVRRLQARGGMVTWDQKDDQGNVVPAGVYLIYALSVNNRSSFAGKIIKSH